VWWYTSVISAFGRLRQENLEFQISLSYRVRPSLKKHLSKYFFKVLHRTKPEKQKGGVKSHPP
jgi:hypothetical protein